MRPHSFPAPKYIIYLGSRRTRLALDCKVRIETNSGFASSHREISLDICVGQRWVGQKSDSRKVTVMGHYRKTSRDPGGDSVRIRRHTGAISALFG
jgi:hypothetical protein